MMELEPYPAPKITQIKRPFIWHFLTLPNLLNYFTVKLCRYKHFVLLSKMVAFFSAKTVYFILYAL
jgi:hypothetical protein